jgi:hypothetical protein
MDLKRQSSALGRRETGKCSQNRHRRERITTCQEKRNLVCSSAGLQVHLTEIQPLSPQQSPNKRAASDKGRIIEPVYSATHLRRTTAVSCGRSGSSHRAGCASGLAPIAREPPRKGRTLASPRAFRPARCCQECEQLCTSGSIEVSIHGILVLRRHHCDRDPASVWQPGAGRLLHQSLPRRH